MLRSRRVIVHLSLAGTGALCLCARPVLGEPRLTAPVDLFPAGTTYPNYRIPSLVTATDGSLLAIAEGRTYDDPGIGTSDLDVVFRRSTDGGATWSPMGVLDSWTGGSSSNPTTVVDQTTGRIFVMFNRWEGFKGTTDSIPGTTNNTAWLRYSDDNGQTWSAPRDITTSVKDFNNWNTVSFGPGSGIQASNGRLIIPSARWQNGWQTYAVYSNDHGTNWTRGQLAPGGNIAGENQIVQLANGTLLVEARPNTGLGTRVNATSTNGGLTWSSFASGQLSPDVQTAIERYSLISAGADQNRLLFTGPRGPDRTDLVIRASYDEGANWLNEWLLYDGYSGYSDITTMPDGSIGVLFETAEARTVSFVKLNREWIEPPQRLKAYDGFRYNTSTLGTKNGGLNWNAGWAGSPTLTGTPTAKIENSDLAYTSFPFALENQRRVFLDHGGTLARALPEAIDLNSTSPYYFSLLVRQDNLGSETESSAEALDVSLYSSAVKLLGFGVRGNESLYADLPGASTTTSPDSIDKNVAYYIVAKIVPEDSSSGANRDKLYVKAFRSGDAVPATEDTIGWTLLGTAGVNSSSILDRIVVKGGTNANWLVDELRFGTSFGSVVSNVLQFRWNVNANGSWTTSANWLDGSPKDTSSIAEFGEAISAPRTITLDAPRTVAGLKFNSVPSYTIAGISTLTLDSASGNASIVAMSGSHLIETPINLGKSLDVNISTNASLQLSQPLIATTRDLVKTGDGTFTVPRVDIDALSVSEGTVKVPSLLVSNDPAARSVVRSLAMTGGRVDLANSSMDIVYSGSSPVSDVRAALHAGYASGAWNGLGIVSSLAGQEGMSIAYLDSGTMISLRYALPGDVNLDGRVNTFDFNQLAGSFGAGGGAVWAVGDVNFDGAVRSVDFSILAANYGRMVPAAASLGAFVPEPSCSLVIVVTCLMSTRRRR